jgi:hypothetical protein
MLRLGADRLERPAAEQIVDAAAEDGGESKCAGGATRSSGSLCRRDLSTPPADERASLFAESAYRCGLSRSAAAVPLPLHNIVTRDDAVASLAGGAPAQPGGDGEFVAVSGIVVAFLRLGGLRFSAPSTVEWRPGSREGRPPWLLDPYQRPFPRYHLLIEQPGGFFYAGEAHLGSFATDGSSATFSLREPLPRDFWVRVGGYPHWLVELNHQAHQLSPDQDQTLRALLGRLMNPPYGHLTLTRYEQDALHLFTNATRGWLMYLREPADSGLYVAGAAEEDEDEEEFRCDCGITLEFPRSRTLPARDAADLVMEFFRSGRLPESARWEPE